jgi:hypothetical protein
VVAVLNFLAAADGGVSASGVRHRLQDHDIHLLHVFELARAADCVEWGAERSDADPAAMDECEVESGPSNVVPTAFCSRNMGDGGASWARSSPTGVERRMHKRAVREALPDSGERGMRP